MSKTKYIAGVHIPAIGGVTRWIRTAKFVLISATTPPWMVQLLTDILKEDNQ